MLKVLLELIVILFHKRLSCLKFNNNFVVHQKIKYVARAADREFSFIRHIRYSKLLLKRIGILFLTCKASEFIVNLKT